MSENLIPTFILFLVKHRAFKEYTDVNSYFKCCLSTFNLTINTTQSTGTTY